MTHQEIEYSVTQYLAGKLSPAEKAAFEAALKGNSELQAEITFQVMQQQMIAQKGAALQAETPTEFVRPARVQPFVTLRNLGKIAAVLVIGLCLGLPFGKYAFSPKIENSNFAKHDSSGYYKAKLVEFAAIQREKEVALREKDSLQNVLLAMQNQPKNLFLSPENAQKYVSAKQALEKTERDLGLQVAENLAFHAQNINLLQQLKACKKAIGEYGFAGNKALGYQSSEDIAVQNSLKNSVLPPIPANDSSYLAAIRKLNALITARKEALKDAVARLSLLEKEKAGIAGELKSCEGEK